MRDLDKPVDMRRQRRQTQRVEVFVRPLPLTSVVSLPPPRRLFPLFADCEDMLWVLASFEQLLASPDTAAGANDAEGAARISRIAVCCLVGGAPTRSASGGSGGSAQSQ